MIDLPRPGVLINPVTQAEPMDVWQLLAGPVGLLAFLPLIPLVRFAARRHPRAALTAGGLIWLFATLPPPAALILLASVFAASGYVAVLGRLRRANVLGRRGMTAFVWLGLNALALPLWWVPYYSWYDSPITPLHAIGFAYFLLRLISWGVDLARAPHDPLRPADTLCWLLYPPCMRLGPLLRRGEFLQRLDVWNPAARAPLMQIAGRLFAGMCGMALLMVLLKNTPKPAAGAADFFASPESYPTRHLLRALYFLPIQVYLFLWSYAEFARGASLWVGITVDENFDHLPLATSVKDFWRRWHITVSAWMRDYVYVPVGGNRIWAVLSIGAVFGYCGLWHGASWSFLAWGGAQVLALSAQRAWDRYRTHRARPAAPAGWLRIFVCWLLTMHFAVVTIFVFCDFHYAGTRFFPELLARLFGTAS